MMPPPVLPEDLPRPDLVLVTHAHTDHMDPDTLGPLAARFPDLPFVVPAAREEAARTRIGAGAQLILADAGDVLMPLPGLRITVLPAAHETRERDGQGRHLFLGYGIAAGRRHDLPLRRLRSVRWPRRRRPRASAPTSRFFP